jgi:hypothetical protein
MESAQERLKSVLDKTVLSPPKFGVIANVNAEPYPDVPRHERSLAAANSVSRSLGIVRQEDGFFKGGTISGNWSRKSFVRFDTEN